MEWRPPENASDISRLNKLVTYYESVNLDQIQQIANLKQSQEANTKTILEYEKNKKMLTKTIKSLEGRMKFDKIAADGTKKKFNLLEYEVREIKHSNEQMSAERHDDKTTIAQLKEDLNSNRSDKLKFMHENAILKKQAAALTSHESSATADAVFARSDLLDKLQMLDNVMAQNETLRRTVSAQSEEMLTLSHEQHDLNEKLFAANKQVVSLELMTAEYNRTIDILQHEISRLRKELASSSHSFNVKSTALLTRGGASNPANRISTDITHSSYDQEGDGPYALARRPHTQQGLSRERNQLASTASVSSSGRRYELPYLGDLDRTSQSRGAKRAYQYVDLSSHLHKPADSSSSAVLVAGGSIGTNGNSLNTTVRTHLLQDYSDVIVAAQVGPGLRAGASDATRSSEAAAHGSDSSTRGNVKSMTGSNAAMCSPVSTPFRRPPSQASPLKSHHVGQHSDLSSWFQEDGQQTKDSLSNIKKCYSLSAAEMKASSGKAGHVARANTAAGRQEGIQSHNRALGGGGRGEEPFSAATSAIIADASAIGLQAMSSSSNYTGNFSPSRVSFQHGGSDHAAVTDANVSASVASKRRQKNLPPPETNNKKSMFVGAGLGLKHNQELDAELRNLNKGSTHQILKKILGDRFD